MSEVKLGDIKQIKLSTKDKQEELIDGVSNKLDGINQEVTEVKDYNLEQLETQKQILTMSEADKLTYLGAMVDMFEVVVTMKEELRVINEKLDK